MKEKKKFWYLRFTYVDNYGIQHSCKYLMPKDFQKSVCVVFDGKQASEMRISKPKLIFE